MIVSDILFKLGATTDVFFVDEDLWDCFNRLTDCLFKVRFANPFCMNIDILKFKVIASFNELLRKLYRSNTLRTAWTAKNYDKHINS